MLLMIDSFSKRIWLRFMNLDTTTEKTLAVLWEWFCGPEGFPTTLVSDNGPQLVSHLFEERMKRWNVTHLVIPPYHAASNGLAERGVGICKERLKKMDPPATPIKLHVALQYICRVQGLTPTRSTGRCPYELCRVGQTPSLFPALSPSDKLQSQAEKNSILQSKRKIRTRRSFMEDERVVVFDIRSKTSSEGVVLEVLGRNTYLVEVNGVSKHISGDCLTENKSDRKTSDSSDLGDENLEANLQFDNDQIQWDDDNMSVASDSTASSIDFPRPQGPLILNRNINYRRRRRNRMMLERLDAPIVQDSRLRSGY